MLDHRKYSNQVGQRLRDDLLAQLRMTRRPMSTSELRDKAPGRPLCAGSAVTVAPLQEQVYRALCVLRVHGKVEQHRSEGRIVSWVAVADTDTDAEIAELEAAFQGSPRPRSQAGSRFAARRRPSASCGSSDEQAVEVAPGAGGAWATKAHITSPVSSAPAARDPARQDRTVYRFGALLIVVGITLTMLLCLMVYAFASGFAPSSAVECQTAATVRSTNSPLPQAGAAERWRHPT
ncbi:hypothetical protein ORI20_15500 [Mycobacterium sp. CVI_P3]|uniref:Uncharacterized protein n=1 Tax=Mycobacterium pinniadriaticum TaxID=2994102 RepID=A0ABT3SFE9_9MYCO|nr:hypothetical protein [Mycobacterium pinniadriaticum]MCX2931686.1 hypothetical protein [Mycobacterium pinniadriaticum]MCX2938239.1 hypothetical protein [Mycobacterium pinniadriaticum]